MYYILLDDYMYVILLIKYFAIKPHVQLLYDSNNDS